MRIPTRFRAPARAALALALWACSPGRPGQSSAPPPPPPPDAGAGPAPGSVMGAIVAANVTWNDHFNRSDAAGVAGLFTPDAVLMTPAGDVQGIDRIRDHFSRMFDARRDSVLGSHTATELLDVAGDRAYEAGTVVYAVRERGRDHQAARESRVRYMIFWQRVPDGRWLIRRMLRTD